MSVFVDARVIYPKELRYIIKNMGVYHTHVESEEQDEEQQQQRK